MGQLDHIQGFADKVLADEALDAAAGNAAMSVGPCMCRAPELADEALDAAAGNAALCGAPCHFCSAPELADEALDAAAGNAAQCAGQGHWCWAPGQIGRGPGRERAGK